MNLLGGVAARKVAATLSAIDAGGLLVIGIDQPSVTRQTTWSVPLKGLAVRLSVLLSNAHFVWFTAIPLVFSAGIAAAAYLNGFAMFASIETLPWLLAIVFVGLPHGAADLAVLKTEVFPKQPWFSFGLYVAGMGVIVLGLLLSPSLSMSGFLLFSVWHFGRSEEHLVTQNAKTVVQAISAIARGGFLLGVPLFVWPKATQAVTTELGSLLASLQSTVGLEAVSTPLFLVSQIKLAGMILVSLSLLCWLVVLFLATQKKFTAKMVPELVLGILVCGVFGLLSIFVPPLLSVGVFFLCWHAWRQLPIVACQLGSTDSSQPLKQVAFVHWAALPLLVPVWLCLGVSWWVFAIEHSFREIALLSLLVYLIVTPSHEILCAIAESLGVHSRVGDSVKA